MEQLKLVELEPQTPLPPLSAEELAELNSAGIERAEEATPGKCEVKVAETPAEAELSANPVIEKSEVASSAALSGGSGSLSTSMSTRLPLADCPSTSNGKMEAAQSNGKVKPGHAHSAHQRITEEGNLSADLPSTYRANGQHKKSSDERRMASEPPDPGAKSNGRPKRVVQGGMPRDWWLAGTQ